jgi:hypothetical protein
MAEEEKKMTRNQRYHALNREQRCAKRMEIYYNSPEVIAKKEERERKKAQRELAKKEEEEAREAKKAEIERTRQEMLELAIATRKQKKTTGALDSFLDGIPPAGVSGQNIL